MKGDAEGNSKGKKRRGADFIDIDWTNGASGGGTSINDDGGPGIEEEERQLDQQEQDILKEFEENDKQLEVIAGRIVQALSKVKLTAQEMNTAIKK